MSKIAAAMDMSRSPEPGNETFIAVVVGMEEHIRSVINTTGYGRIHMRGMSKKDQRLVVDRISLDRRKCVVFCIKINRTVVADMIEGSRDPGKHTVLRRRVMQAYNRLVLGQIRDAVEGFILGRGYSIQDVVFECDDDCIDFTKDVGLQYIYMKKGGETEAHMLADATAWMNAHGIELDGIIVLDLTKKVGDRILRNFMK